jgi:hypothetical protein
MANAFKQKVIKIQESTRHHETSKVVRTEEAAKLNVQIRSKVGERGCITEIRHTSNYTIVRRRKVLDLVT